MTHKKADYASLRHELDEILERLQGDVDVDAAVHAYERGMVLVKELEQYLHEAENHVTKLQTKFDAA